MVLGIQLPMAPLPSWPYQLKPQAHTVPSDLRATGYSLPVEMAVQLVAPIDSWVGVVLDVAVPSRSDPLL